MRSSNLLALAASLSTSAAVYQGFNYGSTQTDGSFKFQADFQAEFQTAKNLVGTSGFTSARLYTMIQGGSSTNEPTQAIPAAIAEGTTLLLGLWASAGQGGIDAEITALKSAISQYGTSFTNIVAALSVGSEDLYRNSPTGIAAKSGYGAEPNDIASYISQVRSALAGTPLSGVSIGHVDTWTAWVNGSNQAVINACDWIGMDAYPYFQNTESNGIESGQSLFNDAYAATQAAVGGKEVWITETGWPVSGSTQNLAVPSLANAKTYWDEVGCASFGKINTYWFTLQDAQPITPNPSFGIVGGTLSTTPLYDLSCSASSTSSSTSGSPTSGSSTSGSTTSGSSTSGSSSGGSGTVGSTGTSASNPASTLSTSGAAASSGAGLTPGEGAGNGIGSSSSSSTGSSQPGNGSSVSTGTQATAQPTTSGSKTGASTTPSTVSTNAAAAATGSVIGVIGALIAVLATLY